jgi:hypothetical protein
MKDEFVWLDEIAVEIRRSEEQTLSLLQELNINYFKRGCGVLLQNTEVARFKKLLFCDSTEEQKSISQPDNATPGLYKELLRLFQLLKQRNETYAKTICAKRRSSARICGHFGKDTPLSQISEAKIQEYADKMITDGRGSDAVKKDVTVLTKLLALNGINIRRKIFIVKDCRASNNRSYTREYNEMPELLSLLEKWEEVALPEKKQHQKQIHLINKM